MVPKKTHLMIGKSLQQFLTAVSNVSVEAYQWIHEEFTKYSSVGTGLSSAQDCSRGIQERYFAAGYISQMYYGSSLFTRNDLPRPAFNTMTSC